MNTPKKYKLEDVTFMIPIRIDSDCRLENVNIVTQYLLKNFETNIIILEADTEEKVEALDSVTKIFVEDYNLIFHRTKYLNQMTLLANTAIVAIWDSDVIVPPEQIIEAVGVLRKNIADMMSPYDGTCLDVTIPVREEFQDDLDILLLKSNELKMKMIWDQSVGGAVIVNRERYIESGMENENFFGWGFEDMERVRRWEILGYKCFRIDGSLYHLWHPKGLNSNFSSTENRKIMEDEVIKISKMSKPELKQYIKQSFKNKDEAVNRLKFDSVLIITYGRSGSTLLQGILNSIDGCLVRGENNNICYHFFKAFQALKKTKGHKGQYSSDAHFGSNQMNEKLFVREIEKLVKTQLLGDQLLNKNVVCYGFKEIRYLRIGDDFINYIDFLQLIMPNVALVFNTRKHQNVLKSDWWAEQEPNEVIGLLEKFEKNAKQYMKGKNNCFHIEYEDVIENPKKVEELFLFLGAEFKKDNLDKTLRKPHSYNPRQKTVKRLYSKLEQRV